MNFNYHKADFRGVEEPRESGGNARRPEESKMYYGCRKDLEESEYKTVHNQPKDGAVAPKPSDVRNGDLVSLLLAATPPYLYNIPLIPQTFFFSEMLKSFVQAKADRQNLKAQQGHQRRQRKRSWRELTPPKPILYETTDKPLELTTPRQNEEKPKVTEKVPSKKFHGENSEKKFPSAEFGSSNFTAEKLANSSIPSANITEPGNVGSEILPPTPPLWYPPLYPPHPPYGIDPLHFFIDLRVSAHVWDRKLAADKLNNESNLPMSPLNLQTEAKDLSEKTMPILEPALSKSRHNSAFSVPAPRKEGEEPHNSTKKSPHSVHYVMSNLKNIYKAQERKEEKEKEEEESKPEGEEGKEKDGKKCKDLRALIGLELVVDYVKQESDVSEDEDQPEVVNTDETSEDPDVCTKE